MCLCRKESHKSIKLLILREIRNMAKKNTNHIGVRGESIFMTRITEFDLIEGFFLGDKSPIVDFYMDIIEGDESYQFLVQVKSTTLGYDSCGNLRVSVPEKKYKKLQKKKLPTYVAGVDVKNEVVYICSAFQEDKTISSMPVKHSLKKSRPIRTKKTIELLRKDVIRFWSGKVTPEYKNNYKSYL